MDLLSVPVLVFAAVVIVLALAFRPELRDVLTQKRYRIDVRRTTMRVVVRKEDTVLVDVTSDVAPGDLKSVMAILDRQSKGKESWRERIRFWHVVCVLSLIGSIAILIASSDDSNLQGAWAVIGAVIGVLVKPSDAGA